MPRPSRMSLMHSSLIVLLPPITFLSSIASLSFERDQELNGYPSTRGGICAKWGHRCLLLLGELWMGLARLPGPHRLEALIVEGAYQLPDVVLAQQRQLRYLLDSHPLGGAEDDLTPPHVDGVLAVPYL